MTTICWLTTTLLAPVFQFVPEGWLGQIFHRAPLYGAALFRLAVLERIIVQLEVGIDLPNDVVEPENEDDVVGLDEAPEPPEPPEVGVGMPDVGAIVPGANEAQARLMRSLYGILRPPTP